MNVENFFWGKSFLNTSRDHILALTGQFIKNIFQELEKQNDLSST